VRNGTLGDHGGMGLRILLVGVHEGSAAQCDCTLKKTLTDRASMGAIWVVLS